MCVCVCVYACVCVCARARTIVMTSYPYKENYLGMSLHNDVSARAVSLYS